MDNLRLLTFITICCGAFAIKINELVVPAQLQHGHADYAILDCKYEIENADDMKGLVLKWFFEEKPVYQWIPDTGRNPEAFTPWKERIDLSYNVSNDRLMKYRALKITNITTDITGKYTCTVSSYDDEASRAKTMVIYEPPDPFNFDHLENESMLLCSAYETFPKPDIRIYASEKDENDEYSDLLSNTEEKGGIDSVEEAHGSYNVTKSYEYDPLVITEPVEFICELTFPNTTFRRIRSQIVMPEGETTSTTSQYDIETTTMTTTTIQSIVPSVNSGFVQGLSVLVLLTSIFGILSGYL